MNQDKVERAQGDLNLDMKTLNNLISGNYSSQQFSSKDSNFYTKTKSLSILQDTQQQFNIQDIIPFYNEIDQIIFYHTLKTNCFYSELNEYDNIEQIKNQRILLQKNSASKVTQVMDFDSKQLMVIKDIVTHQLENAVQKLDEYKIHYNMNQNYPQTSLKLFIPVQISKKQQNYRIVACMERAQFNLFDYSREYKISQEYAQYILFLILQQILEMHSINIAHRDVKPQNIFFVKEKGWLLSDFGESQVYQEVDSLYNIRGTIYFLPKYLKVQINQKSKVKQNLLYNDIYSLAISIIMIQSQQYIPNIQDELEDSNDQVLKHLLQIKQLDDLKNFLNHKNFVIKEKYHIIQSPIYIKLNPNDIEENQKLVFKSQIWLYYYYMKNQAKIKVKFVKQLKQIIEQRINKENFMTLDTDIIYTLLNFLNYGLYLNLKIPQQYLKNFDKYDLEKKQILINLLFCLGFNEKTIYYAKKLMNSSYIQKIHLFVIKSYQRNSMDNWKNEQILFNQYLQLDQLDTYCILDYVKSNDPIEQTISNLVQSPVELINQEINQNCDNFPILYKQYKKYLETHKVENIIVAQEALELFIISIHQQPITLYKKFLNEKFLIHSPESFIDKHVKAILLQDLSKIYNFLKQSQLIRKQIKKINEEMFDPDSYQQIINYQIQIYSLKITLKVIKKKKQFDSIFQKIMLNIQNIQKVTIIRYKECIAQNLLVLVNELHEITSNNHFILYIIQFGIEYAYQTNYHMHKNDILIKYSILVLEILFELRNSKRMVAFINKYDLRSNDFSKQLISRVRNNLILGGLKSNLENKYFNFRETLHQKFIYQQYLDRQ